MTDPHNGSTQSTKNGPENEQKDAKRVQQGRYLEGIVDGVADGTNNKLFLVADFDKGSQNVTEHESAVVCYQKQRSKVLEPVIPFIDVSDNCAERAVGEGKKQEEDAEEDDLFEGFFVVLVVNVQVRGLVVLVLVGLLLLGSNWGHLFQWKLLGWYYNALERIICKILFVINNWVHSHFIYLIHIF